MKTYAWKIGAKAGLAVAVVTLVSTAGFAHRELTAPCSDYKAASFFPAAHPGYIPCDQPLPMAAATLDRSSGSAFGWSSGRVEHDRPDSERAAGRWASPSAFSGFPTTPWPAARLPAAGQGKRKVV